MPVRLPVVSITRNNTAKKKQEGRVLSAPHDVGTYLRKDGCKKSEWKGKMD